MKPKTGVPQKEAVVLDPSALQGGWAAHSASLNQFATHVNKGFPWAGIQSTIVGPSGRLLLAAHKLFWTGWHLECSPGYLHAAMLNSRASCPKGPLGEMRKRAPVQLSLAERCGTRRTQRCFQHRGLVAHPHVPFDWTASARKR